MSIISSKVKAWIRLEVLMRRIESFILWRNLFDLSDVAVDLICTKMAPSFLDLSIRPSIFDEGSLWSSEYCTVSWKMLGGHDPKRIFGRFISEVSAPRGRNCKIRVAESRSCSRVHNLIRKHSLVAKLRPRV